MPGVTQMVMRVGWEGELEYGRLKRGNGRKKDKGEGGEEEHPSE